MAKLTIETANTYLDEAYAAAATEVEPGQYVMIAVADTGTGISREIAEKVFEPFSVSSRILRAAKSVVVPLRL